ncbi:MAG: hypothetical protein ACPIOQ_66915, partial [Promethearchaeia archaeon]
SGELVNGWRAIPAYVGQGETQTMSGLIRKAGGTREVLQHYQQQRLAFEESLFHSPRLPPPESVAP